MRGGSHSLGKCAVLPLHLGGRLVHLSVQHPRHLPVHGLGQGHCQLPGGVPAVTGADRIVCVK